MGHEYVLAAFLDDMTRPEQYLCGRPVWGPISKLSDYRDSVDAVVIALGNNVLREKLHERVKAEGIPLATVIHPAAVISPSAVVGRGSTIMAGAIVGTEAQLGEGVIINCGAVVDHDCVVESFGHLGINASMAGGSVLGRCAWMPAGSTLAFGVKVPAGHVLRAGEVVGAASQEMRIAK